MILQEILFSMSLLYVFKLGYLHLALQIWALFCVSLNKKGDDSFDIYTTSHKSPFVLSVGITM